MLSRWKKVSPVDFQQYNHFTCQTICLSARMLVFEWKERAFVEKVNSRCFCLFPRPYWCTKTVHQYGVSIQNSTKVRETFRQITQKLWATKTWDLEKLFKKLVFYNMSFSWLLPPDGFQFIFFVAWQWKRSILACVSISLPSLHDYDVKVSNFKFCGGRQTVSSFTVPRDSFVLCGGIYKNILEY